MESSEQTVGFLLHGNRYINVTNRCTLNCRYCPKTTCNWKVGPYNLRLQREPSREEMLAAALQPGEYREIVFGGFGEPTLRLYDILDVAAQLRRHGKPIRINTDGLANLVQGRDITPDFEGIVDAISISLNAHDKKTYNEHFQPPVPEAFDSVLQFADRAREFIPIVTLTAIESLPGVDLERCARLAADVGAGFRRRVLQPSEAD
jgi:TatD DNase family protein